MQHDSNPPPALPSGSPREFVHRVNNLLTVIIAQAEISLEHGDAEEMRHGLQAILAASTAMAEATRAFAQIRYTPSDAEQP